MTIKTATTLIDGRPLRYTVRRSARARKLGVEVSRRTGVVVVLPRRVGAAVVPELMDHWADWLAVRADRYDVWDGPRRRQYATGSEILVLGRPRRLELSVLSGGRARAVVDLTDEALRMQLPPAAVLEPRDELEKYLRKLARQDLLPRTAFWAERVGEQPSRVIVGERTTRWGSCSRRRTLSYCYRLIMAPEAVIDAVVAHEVCHLAHLNHGPRFRALLDRVYPGHRKAMAWLQANEEDLLL